eukprot:PLAT8095.1.p1 GENE.PLAT8095.1~~PLAT8095.1.p1  ORF type:complete len:165 (-),score=65.92 PLAT8095.1:133-627(-)
MATDDSLAGLLPADDDVPLEQRFLELQVAFDQEVKRRIAAEARVAELEAEVRSLGGTVDDTPAMGIAIKPLVDASSEEMTAFSPRSRNRRASPVRVASKDVELKAAPVEMVAMEHEDDVEVVKVVEETELRTLAVEMDAVAADDVDEAVHRARRLSGTEDSMGM